jgi:predicted RNA binding protein YcfA (HicA-like mRNA interferase family)
MSELTRLAGKLIAHPESADIDGVTTLLGLFGYALRKGGGSHRVFHKPGAMPITVPTVGMKIKKEYIEMLVKKLGLEDYLATKAA